MAAVPFLCMSNCNTGGENKMMDSGVQDIGEHKTNILLTLNFVCCILENTKEGVAVGISYRDVCAECVLSRQKLQCCVLGRCTILLCKFRKSDAGLYATTCFIRQCLDMVSVFWRTEPKHNDCKQECCFADP